MVNGALTVNILMLGSRRRVVLVGEAPVKNGAVPFAPGTATRAALATLLGVAEADLEQHVVLHNALVEAQPAQGWGRAFDVHAARQGIVSLMATGVFEGAATVFLGWRVSGAARAILPHLPLLRGVWGLDGKAEGRAAWVRHPAYKRVPIAVMRRDWSALGFAA